MSQDFFKLYQGLGALVDQLVDQGNLKVLPQIDACIERLRQISQDLPEVLQKQVEAVADAVEAYKREINRLLERVREV